MDIACSWPDWLANSTCPLGSKHGVEKKPPEGLTDQARQPPFDPLITCTRPSAEATTMRPVAGNTNGAPKRGPKAFVVHLRSPSSQKENAEAYLNHAYWSWHVIQCVMIINHSIIFHKSLTEKTDKWIKIRSINSYPLFVSGSKIRSSRFRWNILQDRKIYTSPSRLHFITKKPCPTRCRNMLSST